MIILTDRASDHPILKLTQQEKAAYGHYFNLADTDSLGVVTGERAVSFFEKTNVPAPVLGEIWQIADTENRGLLTKAGFCMVLRLIGQYQNGQQQPTTELAFKPAPLPKFDGISLPATAQQQNPSAASPTTGNLPQGALQPQLSGQSTGGGPVRVPPLDPGKVQQYSGLFERSGAQNGMLDGGTAKSIFERAGLPNETLGKIWMLSDREQRGFLDQTEFIVAMHLLTSMKIRAMTALPNTLPQGLYDAAARRGQQRPPSRQMSAAGAIPRQFTGGSMSTQPRTQSPLAKPPGYSTPPPQSAQPTGAQWLITQQEKAQYDRYFSTIDTSGRGVLNGEQAVSFFSDSRLSEETLASIWDLADINSEGQLNRDEFAVAMYLIGQQRRPNPPPVPAFLPAALMPPSMRTQQQRPSQPSQPTASAFDTATAFSPGPKSASEDLFGLDSSPQQQQQPILQPQGTGASATRDPFGGSQGSAPSSPARFQNQPHPSAATAFKQFVPTSAFGTSLAQQHTGASTTSSQGQTRGFPQRQQQGPKAPMPSAMDDLLGDNDAHAEESSRLTNDSTELANMSSQIGNLRSQMESTQSRKATTQADLSATTNQKRDLEQRLQQFRTQYENEVRTVKEMEQQLAASRESTRKLNQELAMLEGTYQDLQTQHNTVSQGLQADQQENATLKQKIGQINAEVTRLKPEIEKMKLDARQQKGLVSINKKQLSTNEAERDRLQNEKSDLEREAAETSRSAMASPEPAMMSPTRDIASPAASTVSSTNPFFKKASVEGSTAVSPPPTAPGGPTPSAFDALFGPSAAFAPKGQAESRTGTPPATSFIGRSLPAAGAAGAAGAVGAGAAAFGGAAMADSMSSGGEMTPSATPPVSGSTEDSPLDSARSAEAAPPPPPESRQFTPMNLPLGGGIVGEGRAESVASSTKVIPPASRAGGVETPREVADTPPPTSAPSAFTPPQETEREIIPGAFPTEEPQPSTIAQEIPSSTGVSSEAATPMPKPSDDFDSAFASFGQGEKSTSGTEDPFAPSSSQQPSQARGFDSEFPPIQNLGEDDSDSESDSDDELDRSGFDDSFTTSSSQQNGAGTSTLSPATARVASGDDMAASRPAFTSVESTASDLPVIGKETSPPTYEQSDDPAHGGSGERTASNQFPPEFGDLLPSREDPTSPPPPDSGAPTQPNAFDDDITPVATSTGYQAPPPRVSSLQPSQGSYQSVTTPTTDEFVDASSRPMSSITETPPSTSYTQTAPPAASKNAFDDFDDFNDLSEAQEADKSGNDMDFGFGRQSTDEFNPAFDSPAPSQSQTPTPMTRSVQQSQESNGFANFTPNVSTAASSNPFGTATGGGDNRDSIQQTPQSAQHDWDAIFSGLDSSKNLDTSFGGSEDPWDAPAPPSAITATTNGNGTANENAVPSTSSQPAAPQMKAAVGSLGRAITPGTEHDDPILKRLTGMGYERSEALGALERFDYDINKVSCITSQNVT